MPEKTTSENERQINSERTEQVYQDLKQNFDLDNIAKNISNIQEQIDPYSPGIKFQKQSMIDHEFDQGAFYDLAAGFWNSFVVGSVEGLANLLPTVSNAIHETEFANDWIDLVNKTSENFEYLYSDDYYKPIEHFGDITSSHFWAGLGNGIGFVAGIGKFAKAGQMLSKGHRAFRRGEKLIKGADDWYKAGAKTRNHIDQAFKKFFSKSKAGKTVKRVPKFKEGVTDPLVYKSMMGKLDKISQLSKTSLKNSARIGSFFGGTTMMYNMIQDEAREAGLDRTSAARFSLGVASVVSLSEGMALEWIGKIPARSMQRQIVKAASKKAFKNAARKSPNQLMESFLPSYTKAIRAIDVFEGAAIEFGQEWGQTYIEEGAKQMYDEIFANESASVGKGKFGREVFDLDADSVGGFFMDGKDSKRTFTNSIFAGILGGIIGGGMAGARLRAIPGERNIGNESMFNLIADDVVNDKTKNREQINQALEKARKSNNISETDLKETKSLINEMTEFVTGLKQVATISDPVAQYQLFTLNRAIKNVSSKIKTEEEIRANAGSQVDAIVDAQVKSQKKKNKLYENLLLSMGFNSAEIYYAKKGETLNAVEFGDKILAFQAVAEKIDSGAIDNINDLKSEVDEIYKSDFKSAADKRAERGDFLGDITEEEYQEFKEDEVITPERKSFLASKLMKKEDLSPQENEMYRFAKKEIDDLKEKFIKEDKKDKKEKEEGEETKKTKTEPTTTTTTTKDTDTKPITVDEVTAMPLARTFFADRIARIKEVIDGKRKAVVSGTVGNETAMPVTDSFGEEDSKGRLISEGGSDVYLTQEEKIKIAKIKAEHKIKKITAEQREGAIQEVLRDAFKRALATYEVVEDAPILGVKERVEAFKTKKDTKDTKTTKTTKDTKTEPTTDTTTENTKTPYLNWVANQQGKTVEQVTEELKDVEFITLYRAEGETADRSKLPAATKRRAGTWFTPNFTEAKRYADMDESRSLYTVSVPKAFYESNKRTEGVVSEGEIQLPIEIADAKIPYTTEPTTDTTTEVATNNNISLENIVSNWLKTPEGSLDNQTAEESASKFAREYSKRNPITRGDNRTPAQIKEDDKKLSKKERLENAGQLGEDIFNTIFQGLSVRDAVLNEIKKQDLALKSSTKQDTIDSKSKKEIYTTLGDFKTAEKTLTETEILNTYNQAVKDSRAKSKNRKIRRKSANALKNYIENKYSELIKKQPKKTTKPKEPTKKDDRPEDEGLAPKQKETVDKIRELQESVKGVTEDTIKNEEGILEKVYKVFEDIIERQTNYVKRILGIDSKETPAMMQGASVGNFVDLLGRDFFEGQLKSLEDYRKEANESNKDNTGYLLSKIDEESFNAIKAHIENIKASMPDMKFISKDLFFYSIFNEIEQIETNKNGIGGTLDLIGVDKNGVMHLFDFKNKKYSLQNDKNWNKWVYESGKDGSAVESWSRQLTVYAEILRQKGFEVGSLNVLLIPTSYTTNNLQKTIEVKKLHTLESINKPIPEKFKSQFDGFIKIEENNNIANQFKEDTRKIEDEEFGIIQPFYGEEEVEPTTATTTEQKTGEDVVEETKKDVGKSDTGIADNFNTEETNKTDTVNTKKSETEYNLLSDPTEETEETDESGDGKNQIKDFALQQEEAQKILDNIELFEKIKGHFSKMFPLIPINVVNKIVTKHGIEALGRIGKDGITITDGAFQNSLIHEFSHVYLDLIADKEIVNSALEWIKTTRYFSDAQTYYPQSSVIKQAEEALAQAMAENSVPKLEEKFSQSQLKRWMSIAKRIWRSIKRFFTGVNRDNYIDFLTDKLVFNNKPIMVDTSYLKNEYKYQQTAVDPKVSKFNNKFLLETTKRFVIIALVNGDKNLDGTRVMASLKNFMVKKMEKGSFLYTNQLNVAYKNYKRENFLVNETPFNDLTLSKQLDYVLNTVIYDEGITYEQHINTVIEHLAKIPIEDVSQSEIDKIINDEQKEESENGLIQKEAIKGSKKVSSSINNILARLTDPLGRQIDHNEVFAYITHVSNKAKTVKELKRNIKNDSVSYKGNFIPQALYTVLEAARKNDKAFGTKVEQTLLNEMLSLVSIKHKSIWLRANEDGTKIVNPRHISASRKRQARQSFIKDLFRQGKVLSVRAIGPSQQYDINFLLNQKLNISKKFDWDNAYFQYLEKRKPFSNWVLKSDYETINRLGALIYDVDPGAFNTIDYVNWLIEDIEANDYTIGEGLKNALKQYTSKSNENERKKISTEIFLTDLLNTIGEQRHSDMFRNQGKMGRLVNFGTSLFDANIENANVFINAAGNSVNTIRYGSGYQRTLSNIANQNKQGKIKKDKKVTLPNGRKVSFIANNPVFDMVWKDRKFNWFIYDEIDNQTEGVKAHGKQNAIDLLLAQYIAFAKHQSDSRYDQKVMINDRSHSNYMEVKRLDFGEADNVLNLQQDVDEYLLNKGYEKLINKEEKKKYLSEFNNVSLNFAYDQNGVVKVKRFKTEYLGYIDYLTENNIAVSKKNIQALLKAKNERVNVQDRLSKKEMNGFTEKLLKFNNEKKLIRSAITKAGLIDTILSDHVQIEGKEKGIYKSENELLNSFIINDRINRLAINDVISEPIPIRLIKKGRVDAANILKRNSGFDSLGQHVDLGKKQIKTIVYELKDDDNEDISNSFLFRGKQMTQYIQDQLGEPALNEFGDNSKDGEYMLTEDGVNIYHKNSSINSREDEEGNNNIVEIAKASMPNDFENSNFYKISEMLNMLEEKYGDDFHIQIVDIEAIKGSKPFTDENPMSITDLYEKISNDEFDAIEGSSYNFKSENLYIPFNEHKKLSKTPVSNQKVKFATQFVKILGSNQSQDTAQKVSKQIEELIVEILQEQMMLRKSSDNYRDSKTGDALFQTESVLQELRKKVDDLQDADVAQLLDNILSYNKSEGKILDNARKAKEKYSKKYGKFEDYTKDSEGYNSEIKRKWSEAINVLEEKSTINKLDHPAMTPQLKQVILSSIQKYALNLRMPGAYLKMIPDVDNRLGPNEILLPWSMFGETKEQAEKFLEEQNKEGGLFVPGVRVPASDAISTLNAKVVGLIGDSNMAVLPHRFTIKADADHDGDKVFIYRMDLKTKDKKTVVKNSKETNLYNVINQIMQQKDYEERIDKGSISLKEFEKDVNKIDKELERDTGKGLPSQFNFGSITEMSETDARMSFGASAVGILAVAGKLLSALYQANTSFRSKKSFVIDGNRYTVKDINASKTAKDIAMLLQAALDITKNPVLLRSGIDLNNINVVVAMLVSGIDLKTAIKFINKSEIKSYYAKDQTENNAYVTKANKNKFSETLSDLIEEQEEDSDEKANLETLLFFSEVSKELNVITPIVQLDGNLPNTGYELKAIKKAFKLIQKQAKSTEEEKDQTLLNLQNFSNTDLNKHYEKVIDLATDVMSHHFITENESFYDEIEEIVKTRKYSDVKEFDFDVEKRRVDDMFSMMVSQELLTEDQLSDILENGIDLIVNDLKDEVLNSADYSYRQIAGESGLQNDFTEEMTSDLDRSKVNVEKIKIKNIFKLLSKTVDLGTHTQTLGETIQLYLENITDDKEKLKVTPLKKYLKKETKFSQNEIDQINTQTIKTIVKYIEYKEEQNSLMSDLQQKNKNKFLRLLQLKSVKDENDVDQLVLSGKKDIRYLTSTEKQLAKEDFNKMLLEKQNRFLSYQLFKFGLSNKIGSIMPILPNVYTLDYLKLISNIDSYGEKEKKRYVLKKYKIAQSYNDLNYPAKIYSNVANKSYYRFEEDKGANFLTLDTPKQTIRIKGKEGVRFKLKDENGNIGEKLFEFVDVGVDYMGVREVTDFVAKRELDYTIFDNQKLEKSVSEEEAEEGKNKCKKPK
jgi:hypothetical protein